MRRLRCGQPSLSSRGGRPRLSLVRTVALAVGRWTPACCVRPGAAPAVQPHWTGSWCLRRPCGPRSFQRQLRLSVACVAPGPLFSAGGCPGLGSGVEPSLLRCMAGSVTWWLWMDSCPPRGGYLLGEPRCAALGPESSLASGWWVASPGLLGARLTLSLVWGRAQSRLVLEVTSMVQGPCFWVSCSFSAVSGYRTRQDPLGGAYFTS